MAYIHPNFHSKILRELVMYTSTVSLPSLLTPPTCIVLRIKLASAAAIQTCLSLYNLAFSMTVLVTEHDHTGLETQDGAIMWRCSAGASCCPKMHAPHLIEG